MEQMSLTGSEGGKGRGSALLMWSVQTIQSVCVCGEEREERERLGKDRVAAI